MSPKVFVTGATGYIGGDALTRLTEVHPDWQYRVLVRDEEKGKAVSKAFPSVQTVKGSLDDLEVLETESQQADVVLHLASSDHEEGAQAIVKGISKRSTPGFLIHTSGTGILLWPEIDSGTFGQASSDVWDDMDIDRIHAIPDHAPHRKVDKIVFAGAQQHPNLVKTAIVCPPTIYGKGRGGAGNTRSIQLPNLTAAMLTRKQVFQVGEGKARWSDVHVADLSDLYVALAEAAAQGGGKADWGYDGYYFVESGSGDFVWGDVSVALGKLLKQKGVVEDATPVSLSVEELKEVSAYGAILWGSNSRSRANRAKKLGWKASRQGLFESLEGLVEAEMKRQK